MCVTYLQATSQTVTIPPPQGSDTIRVIKIVKGNSLRERYIDTVSFETIAGNVLLTEALTLFYCDSAAINKTTNILEAFGNVHINQQDSIHTYAQYLKYIGKERIAYLKNNVKLTDKKGTLYTSELEYDLKTNIGKYKKGGKVINGKTTLTSEEGTYFADTKDVHFKKNVHLLDPKYNIVTDSLLYNTQSQIVTFVTKTYIKSKEGGDIITTSGTYDLKNGKAFFGNRTIFKDSTRTYVADQSAYDEATGIAQLEGNAVIKDTVNGYTVLGNQIFLNKGNNSFLATRNPVLIFKGEGNDSTYVAADTLFSGVVKFDKKGKRTKQETDTLKETTVVQSDSLNNKLNDAVVPLPENEEKVTEKIATENPAIDSSKNNIAINDANIAPQLDTTASIQAIDSSLTSNDEIKKDTVVNIKSDSVIRFFHAFHHVRIYNDSLQAVCDSLSYSSEDSIFRMYQNPLVFSNKSQISGDTIYLYTKNKKAERVYVFEQGIIINELNKKLYNQIAGRTLNGYFKNGVMDYMRVKGSPAESIFYPQDDDSAVTGMNRCKGDVIDIYFIDKTVNKVKFVNDVDGILYPMNQIPESEKQLKGFEWLDARRPKTKWELFE